jgi:hypothetical protein
MIGAAKQNTNVSASECLLNTLEPMNQVAGNPPIRISYCTTCMGRLAQIKKTLPRNLYVTGAYPGVEFILVDYSSPDGLEEWVAMNFRSEIKTGRLVHFKVPEKTRFFVAHAKNIAHHLARGSVVCNVDADNFVDWEFTGFLDALFSKRERVFLRSQGGLAAFGRIAMLKCDFLTLGGYDEEMSQGWGYEDNDLIARMKLYGLKEIKLTPGAYMPRTIHHSDSERVRFYPEKNKMASRGSHRRISLDRLGRGEYQVNKGKLWGRAEGIRNFTEQLTTGPEN